MSITDELRKYAAHAVERSDYMAGLTFDLDRIADRIDAEHEAVLLNVHTDLMDASGWVRLPKDSDGEYIHLGEVMEWVSDDECYSPVIRTVEAVGEGTFIAWDGINGRYAQYEAHAYRHYHAPTVEDVLREMADRCYADEDEPRDRDAIVAEYAQRLQLREVDE